MLHATRVDMEYHASPVIYFLLSLILVFTVSVLGGLVPLWGRLTHRGMQITLSFIAGIMVSVSLFDLLPHAFTMHAVEGGGLQDALVPVLMWVVAGFLAIFLLERFICFHHHDVPGEVEDHEHGHDKTWFGALAGLCIHGVLAGVALGGAWAAGGPAWIAILLAIVLHKPFDGLALGTLMSAAGEPRSRRHLLNLAFGTVTPIGAFIGFAGLDGGGAITAAALAFAAGLFLCIALSDLLPELQFHRHDRLLLTVALILGLSIGWAASWVVDHDHGGDDGSQDDHQHSMLLPDASSNRSMNG